MSIAREVLPRGRRGERQSGHTVTLTSQARYRRRIAMRTDDGRDVLLDLPEALRLVDGDGLLLDDGSVVIVHAAAEPLYEIRAANAHVLARIAWHLGNRHTPAEITADAIYIEPDHVLETMVTGLGGRVARVLRPFEPERGAYAGQGPVAHDHG